MALEQLPDVAGAEVRYSKAGRALLITNVTLMTGQETTSDGWIAPGGWLGPPPALRILYFATAQLINKIFAWCPLAQLHKRQSGADRTSTRFVTTVAQA